MKITKRVFAIFLSTILLLLGACSSAEGDPFTEEAGNYEEADGVEKADSSEEADGAEGADSSEETGNSEKTGSSWATGNSEETDDSEETDAVLVTWVEISEEYLTFEELIAMSDVAIVGEYVETLEYDGHTEKVFTVKECLYGDVTDAEIYLYSYIGTGHVEEIHYTYELGADVYEVGSEYLLVMERLQSMFYDHDKYLLSADVFLDEENEEYLMYSQPVEIPSGISMRDYICSVYADVSYPEGTDRVVVCYESDLAQMLGESTYVGTVEILELVNEGKTHNGNTYRCQVSTLFKGGDLNAYGDGTILLVILKDTVTVGDSYIIGFSSSSETSLIYTQAVEVIYPLSDELLEEISNMLTEDSDANT